MSLDPSQSQSAGKAPVPSASARENAPPAGLPAGDPLASFSELESHFGALKRMHGEVTRREAQLAEQLAEDAKRRTELDELLTMAQDDRETIAKEREALRADQSRVAGELKSIEQAKQEAQAKSRELEAEGERIKTQQAGAATEKAKNDKAAEELLEQEIMLQTCSEQIHAREQLLATQAEKQENEFAGRLARLTERDRALAQREEAAGAGVTELQAQVQSLRTEAATSTRDLAEARRRVSEIETELSRLGEESARQLSEIESRLANTTATIASRDAEVAHLRAELTKAEEAQLESEVRLESVQKELAELKAKPPAPAAPEVSPAELAKYEQAIKLLSERLKKADLVNKELKQDFDSRDESDRSAADALTKKAMQRRLRLRRYKSLLQAETRKIGNAQNALVKRQAEADQVLSQRSRLVALSTELNRREARVGKQKARSAAAAIIFYAIAGMGVLLALSWGVAYKFAPATYVAHAVVQADTKNRKPAAQDIVAWQQFVDSLVNDPQLIEAAAERLERRGISEFASPGVLRAEIAKKLVSDTSIPETVSFELRGEHAERAEIVLDSIVAAIIATANAGKAQRPDGVAAELGHAAKVGDGPIADERIMYALGIFGGSSTISLACALLVGTRLGRFKRNVADDLLDQAFISQLSDAGLPKVPSERG